ncbi:MAG: cytochrome c peroxidase [Planctomycetota bacterium]|nr:cytochrome c peroxidase [Planctomycetota bacterium]
MKIKIGPYLTMALALSAVFVASSTVEAQRRGRRARASRPVRQSARTQPAPKVEITTPVQTGASESTLFTAPTSLAAEKRTAVISAEEFAATAPGPLETLTLPEIDLSDYVADEAAAVALGKALFWDQQIASDGFVACATCHYHFGADVRTRNTVAPGGHASAQSPDFEDRSFYGPNKELTADMFPFHAKVDPLKKTIDFPNGDNLEGENVDPNDHEANVLRHNDDVVGSQGIQRKLFNKLVDLGTQYAAKESGKRERGRRASAFTKLFRSRGTDHRAVTGRNAPTTYGAAFHERLYWDGRAENEFNGVNRFGDTDPTAMVWKSTDGVVAEQVSISIKNAALASQAANPPTDDIEMAFIGRAFTTLGQKTLTLSPLATQTIAPDDSVLGNDYLAGKTYADLVRAAFKPEWYQVASVGDGAHTQMEANFSLFWGLSIMLYERTLIPSATKYDAFARSGFRRGFTDQEKEGLSIFLNEGKCINCHEGPFFAGVTGAEAPVEPMQMQFGNIVKVYDSGFYNIGVTPTAEDVGLGGVGFEGTPLSETLRTGTAPNLAAVNGSFKSNTIRNVQYTGPYMHNGSMKSLREVVEFYARGGNFKNEADRSPDVNGIKLLREDPSKIDSLVAFMHTLTDENASINAAPFDHPSLRIQNGVDRSGNPQYVEIEATGQGGLPGGRELNEFDAILEDGGLTTENRTHVE